MTLGFFGQAKKMREILLLIGALAAFDPERNLSQKVKMGLNNFLLDQYDFGVIRTEIKVRNFFLNFLKVTLESLCFRLAKC